jgi:hypothetical protein
MADARHAPPPFLVVCPYRLLPACQPHCRAALPYSMPMGFRRSCPVGGTRRWRTCRGRAGRRGPSRRTLSVFASTDSAPTTSRLSAATLCIVCATGGRAIWCGAASSLPLHRMVQRQGYGGVATSWFPLPADAAGATSQPQATIILAYHDQMYRGSHRHCSP